ncbi:Transcription initiation factor TFIID subunit 1 [Gryllus bimaculatus]|nr:Transcription initiation factor TFIID subunit 1 [Gryllus bimaculatus]
MNISKLLSNSKTECLARYSSSSSKAKYKSHKRRRKTKEHQKHKFKRKYSSGSSSSEGNQHEKENVKNRLYAPVSDETGHDRTCGQERGVKSNEPHFISLDREVAAWRFGPARYWYDALGVPEDGKGFDFGMKIGDPNDKLGDDFPDDVYLMVSQLHWEDEVIWNGDDVKDSVMQRLKCKSNIAGWVPYSNHRTAPNLSGKNVARYVGDSNFSVNKQNINVNKLNSKPADTDPLNKHDQTTSDNQEHPWYSIFPIENEELVKGIWEDEVIWDPENMPRIPEPKIPTWDANDPNLNFMNPEEVNPPKRHVDSTNPSKVKILHPHVNKSKILLGKAGVIKVMEDDAPPTPPESPNRDPFNVSNDKYYMARSSELTLRLQISGSHLIRHATPVMELRTPFVPTYMGPLRLQNFHRPILKRFSHGPLSHLGHHFVLPLAKHIQKKAKRRVKERDAAGGGEIFFMRTDKDLSGRDGDIILVEFSEEHPPLMNLVGMCSRIKNYYKRKADKDQALPEYHYGELVFAHTSPFLGTLEQGQSLQAIENNMYRAPIYEHKVPATDFLIIRTRKQYYIREINALFVAGQECPLYEVPSPNSKKAGNFIKDFLQAFIYRLFWKSNDSPRRIKMEDIRKAFPSHSESSIRKRLKLCADFKRTGMDSNWWVLRSDFRLPSEEELQALVTPEQCCAYFSMLAAEQRLKDAGYRENFLFAPQDDDDDNGEEEMQLRMEDEVKVAPWNTTRAFIQAVQGKCLLQLTGPADPTGCGEGFSYVREPNKPIQHKEENRAQPKKTVSGTDADLRRLSLTNARSLLKKRGLIGEDIKRLTRWEVIDVVRTLCTEMAKAGEEEMTKFSRGNRFSIAEHHERYKTECQRIFDLQNQILSSSEILSSDEAESSNNENSDIEEMGKNIENMLSNKKSSCQLSLEREEEERKELRRMLADEKNENNRPNKGKRDEKEDQSCSTSKASLSGKILKIYRTFCSAEGKEYTRIEFVRDPAVVESYVKIRTMKDEAFIKQFATLDEHQKEEMKREKRCIQEQLRRIKRIQEREQMMKIKSDVLSDFGFPEDSMPTFNSNFAASTPLENTPAELQAKESPHSYMPKRKKPKLKPDLKLKCGGCGSVGHMKTNKACPLYQPSCVPPVNVAMTEEQEEEMEKSLNDDEHLINIDGTKVKLSWKLIKHAEDMKRYTLVLKVPKDLANTPKRRRSVNDMHCDYLTRQPQTVNRRRTDPAVVMSSILETILNEMRDMPDIQPFLFPVNVKNVPDYYSFVTKPMDLQTIRQNIRQNRYRNREEFLADVNQIVENSTLYNGAKSSLTDAARQLLTYCVERMKEKEDRLIHLEKALNPLLDDDQIALTFILNNVMCKLKGMPESSPFLKPANKKIMKNYYDVVKEPMDLEMIAKNVTAHKYQRREEFLSDVNKILQNSILYNGETSENTMKAKALVSVCRAVLEEYADNLTKLEANIILNQQNAYDTVEIDSPQTNEYGDESSNITETNVGQKVKIDSELGESSCANSDVVNAERDKSNVGDSSLWEDLRFSSDEDMEKEMDLLSGPLSEETVQDKDSNNCSRNSVASEEQELMDVDSLSDSDSDESLNNGINSVETKDEPKNRQQDHE